MFVSTLVLSFFLEFLVTAQSFETIETLIGLKKIKALFLIFEGLKNYLLAFIIFYKFYIAWKMFAGLFNFF